MVAGTDCQGEKFEMEMTFELLPPENSNHYGNGYYMRIKMPGAVEIADCRYDELNIDTLSDNWIVGYFGKNAENINEL